MRRIVFNEKERVGAFVAALIEHVDNWGTEYEAIGHEQDGDLIAGVVYNFYTGPTIAMHVAGVGGHWLSRSYLRAAFAYPFVQLGCRRVTGYVPSTNVAARRFNERIGFQFESTMVGGWWDDDIIVYRMLKDDCRWLQ